MVEFASAEEAQAGREKLLASGVLDRFKDKSDPKVLEEVEKVDRWPQRTANRRCRGRGDAGRR